jgi:probable rRNA maturation factor
MPVFVSRKAPSSVSLPSRQVRTLAERMLRFLERDQDELSILLTDDAYIRTLNATHRGKDRPTDVLAFPQDESEPQDDSQDATLPEQAQLGHAPGEERLLGDVVISLDTARRQAQRRKRQLIDEVAFLLAHGILHLLGYDHQNDADEARMNAMTKRLVQAAQR